MVSSSAGRLLGPAEMGLLAALGRSQVRVLRRPRVGVLSTGDEIVDLGGHPGPGQILNSNTYSLMAQIDEAGATPSRWAWPLTGWETSRRVSGGASTAIS